MLVSHKKLIGIKVECKNGVELGKLAGFNIDTDNHLIVNYRVKTKISIEKIFDNLLLVSPSQVIEIKKDKMIVEDLCLKDLQKKEKKKGTIIKDVEPISASKKI